MNTIEHHTCVDILIFNDQGELALQKRAENDKSFPGYWDFSAGGHVNPDEEYQQAAEREVFEELGVSSRVTLVSQEHFRYPAWDPSILREVSATIYKMSHNGPFSVDPKEVDKVEFLSLPAIQKMINEGRKFHPEFLLTWKKGIILNAAAFQRRSAQTPTGFSHPILKK